ncbi:MAG: aminopeptidase P N-terminal domain-containing protein [Desulfobacterales bacterium]|nr:aminopeptidase P N-terminal domain-containing protein [Desulfobacterales bacterium]
MRYIPIDNRLFIENRKRFIQNLKPQSIAIFHSNDMMPTCGDGHYPFVQHSDLFYLTGIDQEDTILLICPDAHHKTNTEILFIKETNDKIRIWEGPKLSKDQGKTISGIDHVEWTSQFDTIFRKLVLESEYMYLNTNEHQRSEMIVESRDIRFIRYCREMFPLHSYQRIAPIMHQLRRIKSPIEIELIHKACQITQDTFNQLLQVIRPGIYEYEIEAEIYYSFLKQKASGPAFPSIVASGPNSCILHYIQNDRQCQDGDVLLIDFGATYAHYASDVTRTIPVNGKFSERQQDIYESVLRIQEKALHMLRPGITLEDHKKEMHPIIESELVGLGLIDSEKLQSQSKDDPLFKTYFMHGISHHLGLDTHDDVGIDVPLEPGMVLTCEPSIYVRDESIGIRIEDTILITDDGYVNLTRAIPKSIEEIHSMMKQNQ